MFEKIKKWYKKGLWTQDMVHNALKKCIISQEQYDEIISNI